jgi:hypothetical protein
LDTAPFNVALSNFLIDGYAKDELGVTPHSLPALEQLTLAIQDVLQNLHADVGKKKLPMRFRHSSEQYNKRDRTKKSQQALFGLLNKLSMASTAASKFLSMTRWSGFANDIKVLHNLVVELIESTKKKHTAQLLKQHNSVKRSTVE